RAPARLGSLLPRGAGADVTRLPALSTPGHRRTSRTRCEYARLVAEVGLWAGAGEPGLGDRGPQVGGGGDPDEAGPYDPLLVGHHQGGDGVDGVALVQVAALLVGH